MSKTSSIDLFIAYAQADADLLERLRIQLRAVERIGLVDAWHDGEIEVGSNREEAILNALKNAEIILLLVSADFIASEFSYEKEVKEAMKLHEQGKAVVIPVILKECGWQYTPFAKLQVLPQNAIPVTNEHWKTTDRAFQQVVTEVVRISNAMRGEEDISTIRSEVKETSTTTVTQEKTTSYSKTIQKNKPAPTPPKKKNSVVQYAILFFLAVMGIAFLFKQFNTPTEVENPITENIPAKEEQTERTSRVVTDPPKKMEQQKPAERTTKEVVDPPKKREQEKPIEKPVREVVDQPKKTEQEKPVEIITKEVVDPPKKIESPTRVNLPSISINGLNWMTSNLMTNSPGGSWCPNNKESDCAKYGRLYLFKNAQNICPQGWRLPSKAEWKALSQADIRQLNLSKSGVYDKTFRDLNRKAYYWSSDRSGGGEAWCFEFMKEETARVDRRYVHWGLACRCVAE